jgi:hypothetical protein
MQQICDTLFDGLSDVPIRTACADEAVLVRVSNTRTSGWGEPFPSIAIATTLRAGKLTQEALTVTFDWAVGFVSGQPAYAEPGGRVDLRPRRSVISTSRHAAHRNHSP